MKTKFLSLFLGLFFAFSSSIFAQNFRVQSGVIAMNNIDSCSTTQVTVTTFLACINWVMGPSSFSVNGSTIDVRVDYTSSFICAGAISNPVFTTTLQNLPPGTYSVEASAFLDNVQTNKLTLGSLVVTSCVVTGIEEQTLADKASFYPNPSTGLINFENLELNSQLNYELIDIKGSVIQEGIMEKNQLNFSHIKKGVYFLRLIEKEEVIVKKVILR